MKLILSVPNLVKLVVPVERNGWVTVQFIHTRSYPGLEGQLYFISSRRNKRFFRHKILKFKPEQKLVVEVLKTILPTESGECLCYFILPGYSANKWKEIQLVSGYSTNPSHVVCTLALFWGFAFAWR